MKAQSATSNNLGSKLASNPANSSLPSSGIPRKALVAALGAVLVAHALVLQVASNALEAGGKTIARPFVTRAVVVSVAAPARTPAPAIATAPARAAPVAAPAQKPRPRPTAPSAATLADSPIFEQNQPASLMEQVQAAPETVAVADHEKAAPPAPAAAPPPEPPASAPVASPASAAAAAKPPVGVAAPSPAAKPPAAVALTLPGSVRLLYKTVAYVKGIHWNVSGELLWLQDGTSYDARIEYSLFNLRKVLASKGRIGSEGLLPTRYSDKFRSSEVAAHFERDKQKVVFSANTPEVPLLAGMQDEVSVFVQLGAMLAGAPGKYPAGTQLSFETIGSRHPDTWVFELQGEEKLSLPGGELATVKLTRPARREFDRTDELWLAPSLGYLPVRIKLTERNGDFIDQQWRATETP